MSARRILSLAALLSLSACSYDFDRPSEIVDRRILAIQVEPPELAGGTQPPDFIQARALVVDPADPAAVTEVSWWGCVLPDLADSGFGGNSKRCPAGDTTVMLSSGSAPLSSIALNIPLPPEVLGVLASGEDVLAPQIQVELQVGSGEAALAAIKEVKVTARLPEGQEPNRNPVVKGLTLDGIDWLPDGPRTIRYGDCLEEQKEEVENADGELVKVCEHTIEPLFDESEAQYYEDIGLSGETELQRERLRFSWFTEAGSFHRQNTEQFDPRDPSPDNVGPKVGWREPPVKTERATVWVVVRDGRGGIHWERREVIFE